MLDMIKRALKSGNFLTKAIVFLCMKIGISNKEISVLQVRNKTYHKMRRKYLSKKTENTEQFNISKLNQKIIWICWFQGISNAPDIVKACYKSILANRNGYEVILITKDNLSDYVSIPQYILDKWISGTIPHAHFSDILRLELLVSHGGIWIDLTTYVTAPIPNYMDKHELFCFSNEYRNDKTVVFGSWFISARKDNLLLKETLALLRKYWQKEKKLKDYFLLHMFFTMISVEFSEEWKKVPFYSVINAHVLQHELLNEFDLERFDQIIQMSGIHKLTYKVQTNQTADTFYSRIINEVDI